MKLLLLGMILRGNVATLSGLILLIVIVALLLGSPLLIIVASRLEAWRSLRNWRAQNESKQKNAPAF
jgi:hypothetical protein